MSLRKRGSSWVIDFYAPNGERIRRSAETENKVQAQELHDKLKSDVWRLQKLGERPKRAWEDAVVRYLKESAHKATHDDDKSKLRWLDRFLAGTELTCINRALVDRITEAKLAEGRSNATVNRTLALLRTMLRRCHRDWEWMDRAPAVRLLKEPTRRIRFLTQDEGLAQGAEARRYRALPLARSSAHLGQLAHAKRNATFCLAGARRMGERADGAAIRASRRWPSGALCGQGRNVGHKLGTREQARIGGSEAWRLNAGNIR
jgi:hypothetical protein